MSYDDNNIFAKILRGEIPCKKIYEDDFVLSFHDINPQKKIHVLVIPKGKYVDLDDFSQNASQEEMVGLLKGINTVAKKLGISVDTGKGYRALTNISDDGGQEVPHLHFHLFGGEKVGKMVEWVSDQIERSYLEIRSINELIIKNKPFNNLCLEKVNPPDFQLNKFFYKEIGKNIAGQTGWFGMIKMDRLFREFRS